MDGFEVPAPVSAPSRDPVVPAAPAAGLEAAPAVSVIMPAYNRVGFLPASLDSLAAQTFEDFEIILVDDGSTDGTEDFLRSRSQRIRYFWQENAGPAAARNHGLRRARGAFVGFLDSDDLWAPRFLEAMTGRLREDGDIGLAFCRFQTIDGEGRLLRRHRKRPHAGDVTSPLFASTFITTPSVLVRRDVIARAGGFNAAMSTNEDYDLWLRLSLEHRFGYVDEPLCRRRSHPGTLSRGSLADALIRKAAFLEQFYRDQEGLAKIPPEIAARRLAKVHYSAGKSCLSHRRVGEARALLRRSLAYRPRVPRTWLWYGLSRLLAASPLRRSEKGKVRSEKATP